MIHIKQQLLSYEIICLDGKFFEPWSIGAFASKYNFLGALKHFYFGQRDEKKMREREKERKREKKKQTETERER